MRKGFTLLELIIVIIIIGILGALGFVQYGRVVERGRTAEAKVVLGQIRSSQEAYRAEYGNYTQTLDNLAVGAPTACTPTHYFTFSSSGGASGIGTATRCTTGGKTPPGPTNYNVTLDYMSGGWSGTTGYY